MYNVDTNRVATEVALLSCSTFLMALPLPRPYTSGALQFLLINSSENLKL
jgi:hypothetical protein